MRVACKSINGVASVNVSLNKGLADLDMKPGNAVTFKQFQDAIAKNGFTTKQSSVTVRGSVETEAGEYYFKVSGTSDSFKLLASNLSQVQSFAGKQVEIQGIMPEAPKGKVPDTIQVNKIDEAK